MMQVKADTPEALALGGEIVEYLRRECGLYVQSVRDLAALERSRLLAYLDCFEEPCALEAGTKLRLAVIYLRREAGKL